MNELDLTLVDEEAASVDAQDIASKVRALVEQENVLEARRLLTVASKRSITSKRLQYWQNVLAPPKATSAGQATGRGARTIAIWLRQHGSAYQGQWVALKDGKLIDASTNRVQLQQLLQNTGKLEGTVFIRL